MLRFFKGRQAHDAVRAAVDICLHIERGQKFKAKQSLTAFGKQYGADCKELEKVVEAAKNYYQDDLRTQAERIIELNGRINENKAQKDSHCLNPNF